MSFFHGATRRAERGDYASGLLKNTLPLEEDFSKAGTGFRNPPGGFTFAKRKERHKGKAASPSVWIKDWIPYAENHPCLADAVYLSLGKEEEHVKNRAIKKVGDCIRRESEILSAQLGDPDNSALVWEEGNHFTDNEGRTARAFAWTQGRIQAREGAAGISNPPFNRPL